MRSANIALVTLWLAAILAVLTASAATLPPDVDATVLAKGFLPDVVPVACDIHCHGNGSDGFNTIDQNAQIAKATGAAILAMTEHLDCIELDEAQLAKSSVGALAMQVYGKTAGTKAPKLVGFENYIAACRDATLRNSILVVPGIEVTLGGDNDRVFDPDPPSLDRMKRVIHLLGVGYASPQLCRDLLTYLGAGPGRIYGSRAAALLPGIEQKDLRMDDAQDTVARMMHNAGLAVIIAHPYLRDPIGGVFYTFYKNKIAYIDGIEFFNEGLLDAKVAPDDAHSLEALGMTNRDALQSPFRPLAVTAGCDYHAGSDYTRFYRWTVMGVDRAPTCRRETYIAECQMIADALRNPRGMILAGSSTHAWAAISGNPLSDMTLYRNGRRCSGNETATPDAVVYAHLPGDMMIRLPLAPLLQPSDETSENARERMKPLVGSLRARAAAPTDTKQLAEFISARRFEMGGQPAVEAPAYATVFPAPATARIVPGKSYEGRPVSTVDAPGVKRDANGLVIFVPPGAPVPKDLYDDMTSLNPSSSIMFDGTILRISPIPILGGK